MKIISKDDITSYQGKPISFTSTFAEGKVMTISPDKKITLENLGEGYDQRWILLPIKEKEVIISSSKNGNMICHCMKNEGNISVKSLSDDIDDCCWKIGKEGEIYQDNPKGGERYLWMADDKLFVTLDGFLAERWSILNDIKKPSKTHHLPEKNKNIFLWLFFILCVTLFVTFYFRIA